MTQRKGWTEESQRHQLASRGVRTPSRNIFKQASQYAELTMKLRQLGYEVVDWTEDFKQLELKDLDSGDRQWFMSNDLPITPKKRGTAFQISKEEYSKRRHRSVPLYISPTNTNKRRLSKANIWYTVKTNDCGMSDIHILPEDEHKIKVDYKRYHKYEEGIFTIIK